MNNQKRRILIIDDEESIRFTFKMFLTAEGHDVLEAHDYQSAVGILSKSTVDLVFADIILGEYTGIDILKEIRKLDLDCLVIIITGQPNIGTATDSVRLGAFDYMTKPIRKDSLLRATQMALNHIAIIEEKISITKEKEQYRINLEAIFRSVREGIITVKNDMVVVDANQAAIKIFCSRNGQIIGSSLNQLFDQVPAFCHQISHEIIRGENIIQDYQLEFQRPGLPTLTLIINCSPLKDSNEQTVGAVLVMTDATRLNDLEQELKERYGFHNIIGKVKKMQEIYKLLEDLADMDTTTLITGESGTGKELIAKALHYTSVRSSHPLITVNCSALAENLLESELFGHVKGAFTGAVKDKTGRFQAAEGGTIFLDEIGDISPAIQVKLLRFLQEKEFEIVGSSATVKADVRVIAATNHILKSDVKAGLFREDLYYRLKVVEIAVPPLRERLDDISMLVRHFCKLFNDRFQRNIQGITNEVLDLLMRYPWPGNIRELEHTMEYAFVRCREKVISSEYVPKDITEYSDDNDGYQPKSLMNEKARILDTLEKTAWNKARTARKLGWSRQTLYRKLEKYKIKAQD